MPPPGRRNLAWSITIENQESRKQNQRQCRPAAEFQDEFGALTQTELAQQERHSDDGPHHDENRNQGANRERKRNQIEPDDAATFLDLASDVKRIQNRLHASICAPDRKEQAKYERHAER